MKIYTAGGAGCCAAPGGKLVGVATVSLGIALHSCVGNLENTPDGKSPVRTYKIYEDKADKTAGFNNSNMLSKRAVVGEIGLTFKTDNVALRQCQGLMLQALIYTAKAPKRENISRRSLVLEEDEVDESYL